MKRLVLAVALLLSACATRMQHVEGLDAADPDDAQERWFYEQRAFPFREPPRPSILPDASDDSRAAGIWRTIGPAPILTGPPPIPNTGRITAVAVSPADSDVVIAGAATGGIWRSADGGASFVPVLDDAASLNIGSIAFAPSNPNVVYAGMGEDRLGLGILKSADAGRTWQVVSDAAFPGRSETRKIAVDPRDENTVWLILSRSVADDGTNLFRGSLYKSVDGGVTWNVSFTGVVSDVLVASEDGATMFVTCSRAATFGTGGIYRSTDRGATWSQVFGGADPSIPPQYLLAMSSGTLFAAAEDSADGDTVQDRILRSTDGGLHWTAIGTFPSQARIFYLAATPTDPHILYLGGVAPLRSTDGGVTWSGMITHVDNHGIAFDPAKASRVWLGNDGGLFLSDDYGATLRSLASKLPVVQFYSVTAHPTDPHILYGGSQDNGLQLQSPGSDTWKEIVGGDVGWILLDPHDASRVLANGYYTNMFRYKDGSVESVKPKDNFGVANINSRVSFIAPLTMGADGTVYFGTHRLFASADFGTTWTLTSDADLTTGSHDDDGGRPDTLTAIRVADSDPRFIYTGSAQGRVMVSKDKGATWADITPPVRRAVTAFAIDRASAGRAWLALSGYGAPHVFRTSDSGTTWTESADGLPDVPVNALSIDPATPATIYAGTDTGVYRSQDGGVQWERFSNGMPPVIVTSFATTADGRLIASTYGRGAYEFVPFPDGRRRAVRH